MNRSVFSPHAPSPIGPFSQGILASGTLLYVSGNIGINQNGLLAEGGIKAQTRQALTNIQAVLLEGGYTFSDVVKVNIFLIDMKDFTAMNEIYQNFLLNQNLQGQRCR